MRNKRRITERREEITMNGRGTGVFIDSDKNGYFFSYDGENYSGQYFSYIDNVLNSNGIVMTKDKSGKKRLVQLSDYIPEDDFNESRGIRERRYSKRRMLENFIRKIVLSEMNGKKKIYEQSLNEKTIKMITDSYLYTGLWVSEDDEGNSLDKNYDINDISPSDRERASKDVRKFLKLLEDEGLLEEYKNSYKKDWEDSMGRDFWLTRNGHGTGFWDRVELDYDLGDKISDIARKFKECNLYLGDDGEINYV